MVRGLLALALAFPLVATCAGKDLRKPGLQPPKPQPAAAVDAVLEQDLAALAPQRPGHVDLYVLGVAGDGSEDVFRNEVLHLQNLAARRLDAAGRVLVLANHDDQPVRRTLPLASETGIARALAGIGKTMDPAEDVLLLYLSSHGSEDHEFLLRRGDEPDELLTPVQLRAALDKAGIRHRVVVISACYSGGFARALADPDSLLLMAARRDRPSFGCGNDSVATYFGRAWLVDGLNATVDFVQAFEQAKKAIERREVSDGLLPSMPQINRGARIDATLAAWRAGFTPGPALPYPHAEPAPEPAKIIPPRLPAGKSRSN